MSQAGVPVLVTHIRNGTCVPFDLDAFLSLTPCHQTDALIAAVRHGRLYTFAEIVMCMDNFLVASSSSEQIFDTLLDTSLNIEHRKYCAEFIRARLNALVRHCILKTRHSCQQSETLAPPPLAASSDSGRGHNPR